jgi:hypothetical protein
VPTGVVDEVMVVPAQTHEVGQHRLATVAVVDDVVNLIDA